MNIAFCYESVLPARGGCETYISDLSRRLIADGHDVHLYACRWDASALPTGMNYHRLPTVRAPRFLRPWRFGKLCLNALRGMNHDVTVGFDKTWGQDILYPQGGLHAASFEHNLAKYPGRLSRAVAAVCKNLDIAHWSYSKLERRQYLGSDRPIIVVNSFMVEKHFAKHYGIPPERLRVVRSAIDPQRFVEVDRPRRRAEVRERWNIPTDKTVGLIAAMNYRLKGLDPLLHAVARMQTNKRASFRLLVAGNPDFRRYERLAEHLRIRNSVHFAGHCPEMRNAYFAADFLVHPTFYDPCSLVVLEALACGLPVITTRATGASEILENGREGFVIDDPHDHLSLAHALERLTEPATRSACARAAARTAQTWTFEQHYRQLLDVFTEARRAKLAA